MDVLRKFLAATFLVVVFSVSAVTNAALVEYRFVGGLQNPEIDFTLGVDFSLDGYTTNAQGDVETFDPSRDTFLVDYISGNFSLADVTNAFGSPILFSRHYGEIGLTPEGTVSCMYALNSIGVCSGEEWGYSHVQTWSVGTTLSLSIFDGMTAVADEYGIQPNVHIASISSVPVPAALWLFGSGLLGLIGVVKRKKA